MCCHQDIHVPITIPVCEANGVVCYANRCAKCSLCAIYTWSWSISGKTAEPNTCLLNLVGILYGFQNLKNMPARKLNNNIIRQKCPIKKGFQYGFKLPPCNTGLTFVLKVSSSWNLWRCPTQLPWEAWHHQPFAITRCPKTTSHCSTIRGQNCGTSLSALWQKGPPILMFGIVLRLFMSSTCILLHLVLNRSFVWPCTVCCII